jgi:hypothetical protein
VDGDTVKLTGRRWTRRVLELTVVEQGAGRRWRDSGSGDQTEALIAKAMSLPEPRAGDGDPFDALMAPAAGAGIAGLVGRALQAPGVPVADLLTAHEVSSALGMPVTAYPVGAGAPVPVQAVQYRGPDGKPVLQLTAAGGLAAQLAVRARRRGQPLPGIGDEAFAGEGWAVGRHGDTVVGITLTGDGRRAEPRNVHWLLATAMGRLAGARQA